MLVIYEDVLTKARRGEKVTASDLAKNAVANVLDPFGMYRAAGRAVLDFLKTSEVSADDATNVQAMLRAGRDAGLDEMEIEVEKERFLGMRARLPSGERGMDVCIEAGGSASGKVRIKAKYK